MELKIKEVKGERNVKDSQLKEKESVIQGLRTELKVEVQKNTYANKSLLKYIALANNHQNNVTALNIQIEDLKSKNENLLSDNKTGKQEYNQLLVKYNANEFEIKRLIMKVHLKEEAENKQVEKVKDEKNEIRR